MAKKVEAKKGFKIGPISGNTLIICVTLIVLGVIALVYFSSVGIGAQAANPLQTESDVGAAILDIGKGTGALSSLLEDLDKMIG